MTTAFPQVRSPLHRQPTVTVRRRVRPRPAVDLSRLTRYRGGTYSHTVDTIVFTDGTSARTDLIRLNPNVEAYSLDFTGVAPTRPSRYRVETWSAVPNLRARAYEVEVDWILRNSFPQPADRRAQPPAAGGRLLRWARPTSASMRRSPATQAAIWHLTNGLELDNRPLNVPARLVRSPGAVTVEFDGERELASYAVEMVADGAATVTLHSSVDGQSWREVAASQLTVERCRNPPPDPGSRSHRVGDSARAAECRSPVLPAHRHGWGGDRRCGVHAERFGQTTATRNGLCACTTTCSTVRGGRVPAPPHPG